MPYSLLNKERSRAERTLNRDTVGSTRLASHSNGAEKNRLLPWLKEKATCGVVLL